MFPATGLIQNLNCFAFVFEEPDGFGKSSCFGFELADLDWFKDPSCFSFKLEEESGPFDLEAGTTVRSLCL